MCGLAGFLRSTRRPGRERHREWLEAMGETIVHRGPDAGGVFLDDGIALVHRRLSILDLSAAGNQPMASPSGRYIIAYNGEIYNFQPLRDELAAEGVVFRTHTDTEVLVALFERDGLACLEALNGMFAIAIWDTHRKELFLARDRLGKKPLYYYQANDAFAFASEIKALRPLPYLQFELRMDALKDYFAYQYVPDPKTIFHNVHKLPPGHWLRTDGVETVCESYWDVKFDRVDGRTVDEIKAGLFELIDDAVRLRMISDVPLGAFLSGGIDSSLVVGLMARHTRTPVTTCSIGFNSATHDEVDYARQVARQFRTDHHEFTVRETVADQLAPIARYFDEPFADSSFVPTYYVSRLARQQVTVALAGDGGDENFAGYSKYRTDALENRLRGWFPPALQRSLFPSLASVAGRSSNPIAQKASSLLGTLSRSPEDAFFLTNCFFRPSLWNRLARGALARETRDYDPAEVTRTCYRKAASADHLSRVLYTDIKTYLPGDILVKVDRMSMANSLETRAPLLDYRVVEYAAGIPSALKLHGREKKHILKETCRGFLTDDILYRKKMGFSVPLANWLRHEIRPLVEALLFGNNSGVGEFFDVAGVRALWEQHLAGHNLYTQELWALVAFELWWQQSFLGESIPVGAAPQPAQSVAV